MVDVTQVVAFPLGDDGSAREHPGRRVIDRGRVAGDLGVADHEQGRSLDLLAGGRAGGAHIPPEPDAPQILCRESWRWRP